MEGWWARCTVGGSSQLRAGNRSKTNGQLSPSQATMEVHRDEARKDSLSCLLSLLCNLHDKDERFCEQTNTQQPLQRAHVVRMACSPCSSCSQASCTWRSSRNSHSCPTCQRSAQRSLSHQLHLPWAFQHHQHPPSQPLPHADARRAMDSSAPLTFSAESADGDGTHGTFYPGPGFSPV